MIPAVIVDDEPLSRSIIKEYLESFPQIRVVQECGDGFEGVKAIVQHRPSLLFLDVQMPKITGFEMLELIEQPPAVIFVTAFDEFAIKAFEAHALDYLLKPFGKERFAKAVEKFLATSGDIQAAANNSTPIVSPQQRQRVVVKTGTKIRIIPVEEIQYIEAADDYVKILTADGSFLKKQTMAHFETLLDSNVFIRTHRSYIINVHHITRIDPYEKESFVVILKDGKQIPVSKSGYTKLRQVLGL